MSPAPRAGVAYGLAVFAAGFVLGTARVLLVVPRIGELLAVAIEVPLMLFAASAIGPWLVRRFAVGATPRERVVMGTSGFAVLMALEWALGIAGFGRSVAETVATYATAAGILGLAGQIGIAFVPLLGARGVDSAEASGGTSA